MECKPCPTASANGRFAFASSTQSCSVSGISHPEIALGPPPQSASLAIPKAVDIATSATSRPRPMTIRPMRGCLWRASMLHRRTLGEPVANASRRRRQISTARFISEEIYGDLSYRDPWRPVRHGNFVSLSSSGLIDDRLVVLGSLSKSHAMTGGGWVGRQCPCCILGFIDLRQDVTASFQKN
jgi:hypothetical protein